MPVFYRDNIYILYVHTPKTGGGSILDIFVHNGFSVEFCDLSNTKYGLNYYRRCSPQHYHAKLLEETLVPSLFSYVFMTCRDPVQRFLSEYLWRTKGEKLSVEAFTNECMEQYKINKYVLDNHIRPQSEFRLEAADTFKLEDGLGETFFTRINQRIGIDLTPCDQQPRHRSIDIFGMSVDDVSVENATLQRISDFYSADYSNFGYAR